MLRVLVSSLCLCLYLLPVHAQVNPEGLALYLSFDENQGKVANDQSPFGNHATFKGNAKWAVGVFNSGVELGVGSWLVVEDDDSLDLSTKMTLSMWVKTKPSGDNQSGIEKEAGWQAGEYNLLPEFGGGVLLQMQELPEVCNDEAIGRNVLDDAWHYIAGTWDGKTIRIYVDGEETKSLACQGEVSAGGGALYIGSRGGSQRWVPGFIDEVKVYSRALAAEEIQADMENPTINLAVIVTKEYV